MPLLDVDDYPFVALHDLTINGVGAFNTGDRIYKDNAGLDEWEPGVDYAEIGTPAAEDAVSGPQRPAGSAGKAAWVDYAVALHDRGEPFGLDRDAAEAMTRDQLAAHTAGEAG
jgi:hypothetical protein